MRKCGLLLLPVLFAACAATDPPPSPVRPAGPVRLMRSPFSAYDAARVAEGAYRASGRGDPEVMMRLHALDHLALSALDDYRAAPDADHGVAAVRAVAALVQVLVDEAEF